jgi:hypothetical protein
MEMYLRAYVEGAGAGNSREVLGRIEQRMGEIRKEEGELGPPPAGEGRRARRERKERMLLEGEKELLGEMRNAYARAAGKGGAQPGGMVKRIIFVEVSPWKGGSAYWSSAKGPRTLEYNRMLGESARLLNLVFGDLGGPKAEVAETYGVLASPGDREALCPEYAGRKVDGGPDYLHPGVEGRRALAAKIVLDHFPEHAAPGLAEIAYRNTAEKKAGLLARR